MKAIVCSIMLLPSLLWAEVESTTLDKSGDSFFNTSDTATVVEGEEEDAYSPEEPQVPESTAKRAKEDNGLLR
ncbi:MAG: phospholipase, partial [Gammaproteobacteria bacterium]|nr:phospholipase [Gammaproteobacteria bacterium]